MRLTINLSKFILTIGVVLLSLTTSKLYSQACKNCNTGIDGDLYSDSLKFGGLTGTAGTDDWFASPGGTGVGFLDTTNASLYRALLQANQNIDFNVKAGHPRYSILNGNMFLDAIYARDRIGVSSFNPDNTTFASGAKNGDNPSLWATGLAPMQSKSDIIDAYVALRREGATVQDDLWVMGGIQLAGNTGSRFFDMELLQNNLQYNPTSKTFSGMGANEGRIAWAFDANGKVTSLGDLIISAEFDNNGLVQYELRIWVKRTDYNSVVPSGFAWGPHFDGSSNSSIYGYADIAVTNGGLVCARVNSSNVLGPVWGSSNTSGTYNKNILSNTFFEFAVNLGELGVDPLNLPGNLNPCGSMFASFMAKTRASASFTSALKDFSTPTDFRQPSLSSIATIANPGPLTCTFPTRTLTASVGNSDYPNAVYTWTASNGGHIVGTSIAKSIVVDAAGTYSVSVKKIAGCPNEATISTIMTIDTASGAPRTIQGNSPVCAGSTSFFTVSGGSAFNWSGPNGFSANTQSVIVTTAGAYNCIVTNTNGCTATASKTLVNYTNPLAPTITGAGTICTGGTTSFTASSPDSGTYSWIGPNSFSALTANTGAISTVGTYFVTFTDANSCSSQAGKNLIVNSNPSINSVISVPIACFGGSAQVTISGSGGSLTYTGTGTYTQLAGTTTYTILDGNNCTASKDVLVTQPSQLQVSSSISSIVKCNGGTATIQVSALGGTAPYTGVGSFTVTAGNYNFTVTDANGCTATTNINVTEPSVLSATESNIDVLCFGNSTGSINVSPLGGTSPYTYAWSGSSNATSQNLSGILAGTYSVTITDANLCSAQINNIQITQPSSSVTVSSAQINVKCFGASTGSIDATPSGGVAPYSYQWSGSSNATSQDVSNLAAGTYSILVTDNNGCTTTLTTALTQPSAALVATVTKTDVACFGNSTGSITLNVTGGTPSYNYQWSGSSSATSKDLTNLAFGVYNVIITDNNACTFASNNITITEPASALTATETHVNVACSGGNTGSINISPIGGTAPFTYLWNDNITTEDRSNLPVSSYSVTITDANGCTFVLNNISLSQPGSLSASEVHTNITCNGANNGSINVTAIGGQTPYSFNWGGGITSEDRSGLVPSIYSVVVTDDNGCTFSINSIEITEPLVLSSSESHTSLACFGDGNASIDITVNGGVAPYSYQWSGSSSATQQDISSLSAGTYSIVITDANGCTTANNNISISQPTLLSSSVSGTAIKCNGDLSVVTVSASGGTIPYSGIGTFNLAAGTHNFIVTDNNGCISNNSLTLTQPTKLVTSVTLKTEVACNGGNAVVTVSATGGISPYSGIGDFNVVAGSHTFTVNDDNGCQSSSSITVTQPSSILAASSVVSNVSCNGGQAVIAVSASGGTAPYTGTGNFNQSVGSQTYTVTDANACSATTTINVTEPSVLLASSSIVTPILCNAGTANVLVSATGGTAPYVGTGSFSKSAGTYTFIVTDANSCTSSINITISEPSVLAASSSIVTPILCNGGTASVLVSATGGTTPYVGTGTFTETAGNKTYTISDANGCINVSQINVSQPTALVADGNVSTLISCNGDSAVAFIFASGGVSPYVGTGNFKQAAGTKVYTVTDANGCTSTKSITVTQPSKIVVTYTIVNPIKCNGGTATVVISATGGVAPYSGTGTFTQFAGQRTYTVADANGCLSSVAVNASEPSDLNASSSQTTQILCNGGTASILVAASGGTAPYSGTGTFIRAAGTHNFTITDANACSSVTTITISQPTAIAVTAQVTAPIKCFGGTATISVSAVGGTTPHTGIGTFTRTAGSQTFTVTDGNSCTSNTTINVIQPQQLVASNSITSTIPCSGGITSAIISATGGTVPYVGTGTFQVNVGTTNFTVKDANNCTSTTTVTLVEPTPLLATATVTQAILCNGGIGKITVAASGGTAPYTGVGVFNKIVGAYTFNITDARGCQTTASATLSEPTVLAVTETHVNILCNSNTTGSIDVSVTGGTLPYSYKWSGSSTLITQDLNNIAAGSYTIIVTDANLCSSSKTISITQPINGLSASQVTTPILCNGATTGAVDVTTFGGTTPYTYLWFGSSNATTEDLSNLGIGTYSVLIKDANQCSFTINNISLAQPTSIFASETHVDVLCNGATTGSIDVTVLGGVGQYTYQWSGSSTAITQDLNNIIAGVYSVKVTDANGCTANLANITISEPANALSVSEIHNNIACNGGNTGTIDVTVAGGTSPYSYLWNDAVTTEDRNLIPVGSYSITITDAHNCTSSKSGIDLSAPGSLTVSETHVDVTCNGSNNGSINITASGGTSPYTYDWGGGITSEDRSGLGAGVYSVTVTDANLCTFTISNVPVNQPAVLAISEVHTNVLCNGNSNGVIDVAVSGGNSPYTYLWSGSSSASTEDISGLATGLYTVTVTDAKNCSAAITNISITEPTTLTASSSVTNVSCFGGSDGAINITVNGGTTAYTYQWSGSSSATSEDISTLTAGSYSIIITDANNCTATLSNISVTQPAQSLTAIATVKDVKCFGGVDGEIDLTVSGGTLGYTYQWSGSSAATSEDLTNLSIGTYNVVVTDAKGCTFSLSNVDVSQPSQTVSLSNSITDVKCFGGSDGFISVTTIGGTAPYSFQWSGSSTATSEDLNNIVAGTYTLIVTDANGCTATTGALNVKQPAATLSASSVVTDVKCFGGNDGAINVTVLGGTLPYKYNWSGASSDIIEDISGLTAGSYSVSIEDANGCSTSLAGIQVNQPTIELAIASSNTDIKCFGGNNASIDITVLGGTSPYSYQWSGSSIATTDDISGLTAGIYNVVATDANSCTIALIGIEIKEPNELIASSSKVNVTCLGGNDGSINLSVSGGTAPYSYAWSGSSSATTEDISFLSKGTYSVLVTDANGCTASLNDIEIKDGTVPSILSIQKVDPTCPNGDNGIITIISLDAVKYSINNGISYQTNAIFDSLSGNVYRIVVLDAKGCSTAASTADTLKAPACAKPIALDDTDSIPVVAGPTTLHPLKATDGDGTIVSYIIKTLPITGILALNGTPVTVNQVLTPTDATKLTYDPSGTFIGNETFTFTAKDNDGFEDLTPATRTIVIVNTVPIAVKDDYSVFEDSVLSANVSVNDTLSTDGGNTWTLVGTNGGATNGTVVMAADGKFTYTPNPNYNGSDSFTYQLCDVNNDCSTAVVTITVKPVDDLPVAVIDTASVLEDNILLGDVSLNDTISGDGGNTWTLVGVNGGAQHGTIVMTPSGSYTYTPAANYHGNDTITYQLCDSDTDCSISKIIIRVISVDDIPVAVKDNFSVAEDAVLTADVATNDTPSGDGGNKWILIGSNGGAVNGSATLDTLGNLVYTPNANYNGSDSLHYLIVDADGDSSKTVVLITITPSDDKPIAVADTFSVAEDNILTAQVFSNDTSSVDGGNKWSLVGVNGGTPNATVTMDTLGNFIYTPNANYNGNDKFSYKITDADGSVSIAEVYIIVTPVDDMPVAVNDTISINEDNIFNGTVAGNDTISGDGGNVWTAVGINGGAKNGAVVMNPNGTYTYTPNLNYFGTDTIHYQLCDVDTDCSSAIVIIKIASINDAPVTLNDSASTQINISVTILVIANDTDVDGTLNCATIDLDPATSGIQSSIVKTGEGTFTVVGCNVNFVPTLGYTGTSCINYTISDDSSATSNVSNICVKVINDSVIAKHDYYICPFNDSLVTTTINGVLVNDTTGNKGQTLTLNTTPITNVSNGTLVLNANGTFTYTPNSGFTGTDSFIYELCDNGTPKLCDTAIVFIKVLPPVSDLSIIKTVDNQTPLMGDLVSFTIVVKNLGPDSASAVKVTDVLNSGYIYVSSIATAGNYNAQTGVWNIGSMLGNQTDTLTMNVKVTRFGNYTNTAKVTTTTNDPDTTNNSSTVTPKPILPTVKLGITKTVNNATPVVGSKVTFTIKVTNPGPYQADTVVVVDKLPNGYTFDNASTSAGSYNEVTGLWNIGSMAPNTTETLVMDVYVKTSGNYVNIATVTSPTDTSGTHSDTSITKPVLPSLIVTKDAGSVVAKADGKHFETEYHVRYTIVVKNTDVITTNVAMSNVQVIDDLGEALKGATSISIDSLKATGNLTANKNYDGISVTNLLVSDSSSLAPDASATISFVVSFISKKNETYTNIAIANSTLDGIALADTASKEITTPEIKIDIPEAFSPDNDGVNETFIISGLINYPTNSILIFNRWGNKVFETENYKNDWAGDNTSNFSAGEGVLPEGTYFYILDVNDPSVNIEKENGKVLCKDGKCQGYVYLKR